LVGGVLREGYGFGEAKKEPEEKSLETVGKANERQKVSTMI
jgi:hypothetical protein